MIDWLTGYAKLWIPHSVGSICSTKPNVEHCKSGNGLLSKGPWTIPAIIYFCIFLSLISFMCWSQVLLLNVSAFSNKDHFENPELKN